MGDSKESCWVSKKNEYVVKVRSITRFLEVQLRNAKANYFDPRVVMEYFERFAQIRRGLKDGYGDKFDDLKERQPPKTSGTTDFDGEGYVLRRDLDQLYEDCRYALDLLQTVSEESKMEEVKEILVERGHNKGKDIFISHASKDESLVRLFVERILRLGLDLKSDRIFCTSLEGMDIQNGKDFREQILSAMGEAKIVFFIITPNYKGSEVCQNEMGAAWYSGKRIVPLIVEPINYKAVGVLMEPRQIPMINDPSALSKVRDDVVQELNLSIGKTDMWDAAKEAFLQELPSVVAKLEFPKIKAPKEIAEIESENARLKEQLGATGKSLSQLQSKYDELVKTKDVEAIEKVEEKFDYRGPLEKFISLTSEVRNALRAFPRVVQAIIVCDYFNSHYTVPANGYSEELERADRKHQISIDNEFTPNTDNREVKRVVDALANLKRFVNKDADPSLGSLYEKDYKSPLEVSNESFWEEHFDLQIPS